MVKTICKKVYDTENSEIVKKFVSGSFGDPTGYEETLYVTKDGYYFVYENGGEESIHPEENIKRIAKTAVKEWVENH
ncbi:MAG: hypothetical protein IJD42_02735 [Clostridia bacterium]|nr:hypothetical protein [Clostridia bacterium]